MDVFNIMAASLVASLYELFKNFHTKISAPIGESALIYKSYQRFRLYERALDALDAGFSLSDVAESTGLSRAVLSRLRSGEAPRWFFQRINEDDRFIWRGSAQFCEAAGRANSQTRAHGRGEADANTSSGAEGGAH